ncbi:unnamed protein product [Leptosia nina]|uniref:Uncharacterized protein n=1 Tax=Leptosia nina TaxID=320188 RepID=A0AAV1J8D5_9NEOP
MEGRFARPLAKVLSKAQVNWLVMASPPGGAGAPRDESPRPQPPPTPRNGTSPKQGALTIVRRSSSKSKPESSPPTDEQLDQLDLDTEHLPAIDTPDACDKAALRLRYLLRQINRGEIPVEILQKNIQYAAKVLEAVYIDETKVRRPVEQPRQATTLQTRRLRTPCWASSVEKHEAKLIPLHQRRQWPSSRASLLSTLCD